MRALLPPSPESTYASDVAYFLAVASAVLYGAADFLGGLAARGAATLVVVIVTQTAGMLLLAGLMPFLPETSPAARDLAWGAAAGVSGSAGVALLYRALAIGTMGVLAPTTAVCAVAITVLAGVLLGERPSTLATAGIVVAIVAIVLVTQHRPAAADSVDSLPRATFPPGLGLALISGVAIGVFFLSLARTDRAAGMWPLLVARFTSLVLFGATVVAARMPFRLPRQVAGVAIACGVLDMSANALYLIAVRQGPLTAVVTLSSLYPASTVVLAAVVLRERLNLLQMIGVVCALVAVALIVTPGR
jgi:drug/metabolite transporter (DMT)-like permease